MSDRDQRWQEKYGRRFLGTSGDGTAHYEDLTDAQAQDQYLKRQAAAGGFAAMVGGLGHLFTSIGRDAFKDDGTAGPRLDRILASKDLDPGLDPKLKDAWVKAYSVHDNNLNRETARVISENIPQDADDWIRSDLSQAGEYKKALEAYNRSRYARNLWSIGTVTPTAESTRFGAPRPEPNQVDFGGTKVNLNGGIGINMRTGRRGSTPESARFWGNAGDPQFIYAGDHSTNPAIHFSGADLPPDEEGRYLFTGEANEEIQKGKRTTWGRKSKAPDADIMFGAETRKLGGVTTMADVFTELTERGLTPPPRGTMNSIEYFRKVSEMLADSDGTTPQQALESLASPHPVSGVPGRETGTVPNTLEFRFDDATPEQLERAGLGPGGIFEENTDPFHNRRVLALDENFKSDRYIQLKDQPKPNPLRRSLARPMGGLIGTVTQSEDIARDIRNGDYGEAALRTAASYVGGEATSVAVNQGLSAMANRGWTAPVQLAGGAANVAALPLAATGTLDFATTLATGKNSRELLVDSGNTGPAIAAMTVPQTMAPLAHAGGPVQATGPVNKERNEERKRLEANAEAARKRGGRWRLAGFEVPEFGLSEMFGLN